MRRKLLVSLVAAFAIAAAVGPGTALASPGKGLIKDKPPSPGASGSIIVTEGEVIPGPDPDGEPLTISVGDTVSFTEKTAANEGDLVSFRVRLDADGTLLAEGISVEVVGTLITGAVNGDLEIGAGEVVTLKDAKVAGDVNVDGGILVVKGASTIGGDLDAKKGAFVFINDTSRVVRKIVVQGAFLSVRSTEIFEGGVLAEGYCVKCKAKKEMQNRDASEVVMKNGRKALKGTCPTCGTKVFRILGKA